MVALTILYLGRRDLTRPSVAFGVPWFGFVALAQLSLTDQEGTWPTGFALVVMGGGLTFVVAALLAGGTAPARGTVTINRDDYDVRRLVTVAVLLLLAGVVGAIHHAHVLGDVPLLSGNPDQVRAKSSADGEVTIPAWSTALTNGLYLSAWCSLAALWLLPRRGSRRLAVAGLVLLAGLGLFGAMLEASRNITLLALAVPAIAVYLLARPRGGRAALAMIGVGAALLAGVIGGAFVLRLSTQSDSAAHRYLISELDRHPPVLRPLIPFYINAVFPLEAERRIYSEVPAREPYGLGANSLLSLPDAWFPEGKPQFGDTVGHLMASGTDFRRGALTWTVSTYQGRLYGDLGPFGVIGGSLLLGLAFGRLYRWARRRGTGFLPVALVGYVVYYSAFMAYDNLLSFTLIAAFDLTVILVIEQFLRDAQLRASVGRLVRLREAPS